jgi:3-hydroxyacyl-[acyl-carrier-protein] dehydratase
MRWIWIDRFESFQSGTSAVAVKAVTAAEEHLHDLYPGFAIFPHSLVIEGMAQTSGILVGEAKGFKEKVILAKIGKAEFFRMVRPGELLRYHAMAETITESGASISGRVTSGEELVAQITLMFSHIDQNLAGVEFPEHNFVFSGQFMDLLANFRKDVDVKL